MTSTSAHRRASLIIDIRAALTSQRRYDGDAKDPSGEKIRESHALQRHHFMVREAPFIRKHLRQLISDFASGVEIIPERIDPEIVQVDSGTRDADLFRLVTALWSVPVSRGFGRRMRFLVRDRGTADWSVFLRWAIRSSISASAMSGSVGPSISDAGGW